MPRNSETTSPAVVRLLRAADEVLTMAHGFQANGRPGDAMACAMFANEYVRAARAMQDMENASRDYEDSKHAG
jgi:hypothetical protein